MLYAIRLSPLAKNVAMRNRAGFKFTHEPMVAELTGEELEGIQGDPFLKVCNHPSVAWFDAFGIERTQKNEDFWRKAPPTMEDIEKAKAEFVKTGVAIDLSNARMAVVVVAPVVPPVREVNASPAPKSEAPEPSKKEAAPKAHSKSEERRLESQKETPKKEPVKELSAKSSAEDLIAALEKKGKIAGKDFSKSTKPASLFALLKSL